MLNHTIAIEAAHEAGLIAADNTVTYTVKVNGKHIADATYQILATPQETIDRRCCFFGNTPFITPEGRIRTRIVSHRDPEVIAEIALSR